MSNALFSFLIVDRVNRRPSGLASSLNVVLRRVAANVSPLKLARLMKL